jgi:glycosyltransferase involved in cell wall biosynthesis
VRITLTTDTYLPEVNGVTTVLATMRRGLLERGHAVQVLAPAYPHLSQDDPDVHRARSIPCPPYPAVRLSWPWGQGLAGAMRRFAPDLVHAVTEGPLGGFGRAYARRTDRPLVTSFHTDFPRYAGRYLGHWAIGPTRRYLRWFHGPARATQTPSDVTRAELQRLGLPRAVTWGRGVDCRVFSPGRRDERRRYALGAAGKLLILYVGRLAVEKGMDTLVPAFQAVHASRGEGLVFCVAGDGPEADRVRSELPFARHFGFLERETLADLYADSDLFVFPSATETCGLVALEAMASGLPVIGVDAGGMRDNVRDGLTGRLVAPGDADELVGAVAAVLADESTRYAMGQAARAFAVGRDWDRELDLLVRQYESVLGLTADVAAA